MPIMNLLIILDISPIYITFFPGRFYFLDLEILFQLLKNFLGHDSVKQLSFQMCEPLNCSLINTLLSSTLALAVQTKKL